MNDVTNIVIAGVGGQGIVLSSTLVSEAAMLAGFDVKSNEVHGMAQRGGSVISQIRFGQKVYSPMIKTGEAHFLVSMEKMEALRYLNLCNETTHILVNNTQIVPVTVTSGSGYYPENIDQLLKDASEHVWLIDAQAIASELGNIKTANVVMMGAMSGYLALEEKYFEQAIKNTVKSGYVDINLKAFYRGKQQAKTIDCRQPEV